MYVHVIGWVICALAAFAQPFGLTAADTKHDLAADPSGFLAGAFSAYSDNFTLGQLQNQAYGYLFPQGAFFLATDFLPDWVAQRAWWSIVLGVGFSGFVVVARKVFSVSPAWLVLGALVYALSPRALTTLTAISSETWPVMLAPWVVAPFLVQRISWRHVAAAVVPVACMGAINATATLAACVPAAIVLLYRKQFKALGLWLLGCALVSAWWIGPLLILGKYAPAFTDYIESAFVTTRWLNLPELLRGATSWSTFVDTERQAGSLLTSQPLFILATCAVAAVGLAGLTRLPKVWTAMSLIGIAIMGTHLGVYLDFLDGAGAFMRNLHKFDPLVRLPFALGLTLAVYKLATRKMAAAILVVLVVLTSTAPAWTGRLLPKGAYEEVPHYWQEAADFINDNAQDTRTLIAPQASFARQDWGWTRDEPAQPLVDTPLAFRDAIPLIPAESIRGLDGIMDVLRYDPAQGAKALQRLGIGAVIYRHDLENSFTEFDPEELPGEVHTFGDVDVILLESQPDMLIADNQPTTVAGGGEILALLDMLGTPGPRKLVEENAKVVTDTPALVDRNFGTLDGAASAQMAPGDESTSNNTARDYPSAGPLTTVKEGDVRLSAESSASDASAFGGANPARSLTAAADDNPETAWWPAPGHTGWLQLDGDFPTPEITLTATRSTEVEIHGADGAKVTARLEANTPRTITVPGGPTETIRVELTERVGIAEVEQAKRVVTVPDTSPDVQQFIFQRLFLDTGIIIREFTAPRDMTVTLDADREQVLIDASSYAPGDTIALDKGTHRLETRAQWVSLTAEPQQVAYEATGRDIAAADSERILNAGRAFNSGLRGYLGDVELEPVEIDAASQAFVIPPGIAGEFRMEHEADGLYRAWLIIGGLIGIATLVACAFTSRLRGENAQMPMGSPWLVGIIALGLVNWVFAPVALAMWAVLRWTNLKAEYLSPALMLMAGAMLARAPWPSEGYAGDSLLVVSLTAAAVACLFFPRK
ncbi:alpha-(1-_3)-arabinofuranosyltransferase domain-containing protein [Corynebacterium casei]|uniref:alpha-(1->3)-arabinofuranosyltransferase domain-containing protein n=1 Tax=Corynebacterium casei TaxID=160386 RepID=UPI003FD32BEC